MGWLRDFVRKNTKPIPKSRAMTMKTRLSAVYYFAAWNLFILVILYMAKLHTPETEDDKKYPSKYYARMTGTGDAKVIRFRGLTKVGEYEIKGVQDPNKTREEVAQERQEFFDQVYERRKREYYGLPEPVVEDPKVQSETIVESEHSDREDLKLLVEETSSL